MLPFNQKFPRKTRIHRFWSEVLRLALLALAYWVVVRVASLLVAQPAAVPIIAPSDGFVLAVLLCNPRRRWTQILVVIFAIDLISHLSSGYSLLISLAFGLITIIEALLGMFALNWLGKKRMMFDRVADVFTLLIVATLINGLTSLFGAFIPVFALGAPFFAAWWISWVSDGLGILLVTPLLVVWTMDDALPKFSPWRKTIETALLTTLLALFSWLLFGPFTIAEQPILRAYMLFPFLIWLAFRFSPRSMVTALLLVASIALWGTLQHYGIFSYQNQGVTEELLFLQIYLAIMSFSGLLLSAMMNERKQDAETLKAAEANYRSIIENAPVGFFQSYPDGGYRTVNPRMAQIFGFASPAEMLNTVGDITHQIYAAPSVRDDFKRLIVEQGRITDFVTQHRRRDGTPFWTATNARIIHDAYGKPLYYEGFLQDIHERTEAEKAIEASHQFVQSTMDSLSAHICVLDEDGIILAVNKAWNSFASNNPPMSGNTSLGVNYLTTCDATTGPDAEMARAFASGIRSVMAGERDVFTLEYPCHAPYEQRWFMGRAMRFADATLHRVVIAHENITERKLAENALRESERNIRTFFETMTEGLSFNEIIYDENGEMVDYRIIDVNPAFYTTADFGTTQVIGNVATQLFGMSPEAIKAFWHSHKVKTTTAYSETRSPLNQKWFYIATSPFVNGRFATSFLDITQQKQREAQLMLVNERLSMAQHAARAGLWDWDMSSEFFNWSPELFELFGLDANIQPNAETWLNVIHEQDRQQAAEHLQIVINEHVPLHNEYRIVLPSGEVRWISALGSATYDEQGKPQRMSGICIDITANKQTQNALSESEARLKGIVTSAMDGIVMIDSQQCITLFNHAAETMFGLPASKVIGQPLDLLLPQGIAGLHKKHIQRFGETDVTTRSMNALIDINAVRATGETFPTEASIAQFVVGGQKFYTAIVRDITERKQMEQELRASILEKEALLKEVHHRVKNNLQIVSSLLSMQADRSKNDRVTYALEESKNRVHAMALIHEKLYRAENLEYIQADEYIPQLIQHLSGSLIDQQRHNIAFDLQIASITFDLGKAIPCGMIITELISNALKYAFSQGQPGVIKVHLEKEAGMTRLLISDNGVGLSPELDLSHPDTLGLELVSILSRQLKAELQIIRQPGTTFILLFRH